MNEARKEQIKIIQKKAIKRFGYTADTPTITKFIYAVMEELGYRQMPELTVLSEEKILGIYKEHNWMIFEPDLHREQTIAKEQLQHTKRELGE